MWRPLCFNAGSRNCRATLNSSLRAGSHQGNWQPRHNAVSSICAAPFSNMCSTQADNSSGKFRLRCGCQFPWCALALKRRKREYVSRFSDCHF
jgi:hypothetical protein